MKFSLPLGALAVVAGLSWAGAPRPAMAEQPVVQTVPDTSVPGKSGAGKSASGQSDWGVCADAGRIAEQRFGIPRGLLLAIGHIETGRQGPQGVAAWPWSVDAMGNSSYFRDRNEAIAAVAALQATRTNSIDVGCFQVNLYYHPKAFASLEEAFDPYANATYAARFLIELHERTGSWEGAVAGYHSAELKFGLPYRDRVLAEWGVLGAPPERTVAFGVRVIAPPRPGNGPRIIAIK